jgi:hypothetical protein
MHMPRRLYCGWVIVAVMAIAGAASMALGTLNYGLFIKPIGDDLLLTAQHSAAQSYGVGIGPNSR